MENRNLTISYVSCQLDELETADRLLVEAARQATYTSYSPQILYAATRMLTFAAY